MKREAARSNKVCPVYMWPVLAIPYLTLHALMSISVQGSHHSSGTVKEAAQKSFEALVKYCEEPWSVLKRSLL